MPPVIPAAWQPIVGAETEQPYYRKLMLFLTKEREKYTVFPPENEVFNALEYTPYEQVNVLLLGQDPYHDHNQAHGLCFSVRPGIKPPPSLQNIFKELKDDLGCHIPNNGYLVPWAKQGILMLNAVLTVRTHQTGSHRNKGWEKFTDRVIEKVNEKESRVVFILWGNYAQQKIPLIDTNKHTIVKGAHPSPYRPTKAFSPVGRFPRLMPPYNRRANLKSIGRFRIFDPITKRTHRPYSLRRQKSSTSSVAWMKRSLRSAIQDYSPKQHNCERTPGILLVAMIYTPRI